ncbi:MAG: NUDIX hydrolase [Syntrophales bacterium]|nr:NUDIX hydrolase [Syntrophales bacterium]
MKSPDPVYECRIFRVYEDDVTLPNGRTSRQSWIEHNPCIAAVPVDSDGRIILIRQYRHATRQILLEITAGNMDKPGESVEECVQRELAEEIGFQARHLVKLFEGYLLPGYCNEYMYYYLAMDLFPSSLPPDEDEDIEILRVSHEEAMTMIKDGQICDSKTALGIMMALKHLSYL